MMAAIIAIKLQPVLKI